MKRLSLLCWLVSFPWLGFGADITIGTTRLTIPAPEGFALISDDVQPYSDISKRFVPPSNEQFAQFLSEADAAAARRGEIPVAERRFYVQTVRQLITPVVSSSDFAELKRELKAQNETLMKKVESQMPGFMDKVNKGISKDYDVDLKLALNQMVPLAPHSETERSLAYSMFLKGSGTDAQGNPTEFEAVVTATFVHVRGKILFLYANAEKSALEWSKAASQKWADSVIAANPSTGKTTAQEKAGRRAGFDWNRVLVMTIIGAVIGGLIGGISSLFRKKKA